MLSEKCNIINFTVDQKASFEVWMNVKDQSNTYVDLTNYTVASKYATDFDSGDTYSTTITAQVVNAAAGEIKLDLTPEQTAVMEPNIKYYYDVAITNNTTLYKTRIIQGTLKVNPGVS